MLPQLNWLALVVDTRTCSVGVERPTSPVLWSRPRYPPGAHLDLAASVYLLAIDLVFVYVNFELWGPVQLCHHAPCPVPLRRLWPHIDVRSDVPEHLRGRIGIFIGLVFWCFPRPSSERFTLCSVRTTLKTAISSP